MREPEEVRKSCPENPKERIGMDQNVERRIRDRAYSIWEEEGRPAGRDIEHWLRAAQEIAAMAGKNAASPEAQGHAGPDAAAATTKAPRRPRATAAGSPAAKSTSKSAKAESAKTEPAKEPGTATKSRKAKSATK
jgi:hypothetical protein